MKKDFFTISVLEVFSKNQIDSVKGILILSVIVGHLRSLAGINLEIFQFVYNYHVVCFLLLPFLYPIKNVTKEQLSIWAFRFLIPYTAFFIAYGVLNYLFLNAKFDFFDVIKGYFIATPAFIDKVTGSEILWFLPHIFLVFALFNFISKKFNYFYLVFFLAFVSHISVGFIPKENAIYVPFTATNILYLFLLGFVLRFFIFHLKIGGKKYGVLFLLFFLLLQFISIYSGAVLGYTGMFLFDIQDPIRLFICDSLVIFAMLSFLYCSFIEKIPFLSWFGKNSIIVFLVHQPFLFIVWNILEYFFGKVENIIYTYIYCGISLFISLLCSSIIVFIFLKVQLLNKLVFPRSEQDWVGLIKS